MDTVTSHEPGSQPRTAALFARYTAATMLAIVLLVVSLVTRVGLVIVHGGWPRDQWPTLVLAFIRGTAYDLVVSMWLLLPIVGCLTLVTSRWLRRPTGRWMLAAGVATGIAGSLFVAAAEVLFFDEFDGRFNFVAVDYLIYPTEVITNIWQSYPTARVVGGILAAAGLMTYVLRRRLRDVTSADVPLSARLAVAGGYVVLLAALSIGVTPRLAHVSEDRALNEIASNGYYAFWQALRGQGTSYDALYATRDASRTIPRIQALLAGSETPRSAFAQSTTLRHVTTARPERRLNVVVVLEESLGSEFIGALHPTQPSLTPRFDSIAAQGALFTRAYSTGNRTIRALEATTASLPPLPGVSIVRRPESVDLFTLPSLLRSRGYATRFVYGGRALFDGMGAYMRNNGIDRVIEQRDYADPEFTTAWGVPDEAIFDRALAEMDSLHATGQPFYTLVLTVSNHRPYTYPAGRIAADPEEHKRVNVVRYADWALGRFLSDARRHAFFDNTVFVLMGDHGPRVYGAAEIPLPSYSVPILFYAPAIVPAGERIPDLASSMDVAPTILGLLGGSYESKFFGRDLFLPHATPGVAVMTHNNQVALMRGHRLAVLGLHGATMVYDVDSLGALHRVATSDAGARDLVDDAIAYFQSADELYRHGQYQFDRPVLLGAHAMR